MHGNHKEQYGSHSLNRWKERPALWHRHAGMSTGSDPYTLRGILSKGAWALMTRLGPSQERGPGTQPHKIVSEFSVHIYHTAFYQCYKYNVFNWEEDKQCYNAFCREDKYMIRTVTLIFHTVFHQLVQCVLLKGQAVNPVFVIYNVFYQKEDKS